MDPNTNLITEEYAKDISEFMTLVQRQPGTNTSMLRCPCFSCKTNRSLKNEMFGLIYIWKGLHQIISFGIFMEKLLVMNMVVLANLRLWIG